MENHAGKGCLGYEDVFRRGRLWECPENKVTRDIPGTELVAGESEDMENRRLTPACLSLGKYASTAQFSSFCASAASAISAFPGVPLFLNLKFTALTEKIWLVK